MTSGGVDLEDRRHAVPHVVVRDGAHENVGPGVVVVVAEGGAVVLVVC